MWVMITVQITNFLVARKEKLGMITATLTIMGRHMQVIANRITEVLLLLQTITAGVIIMEDKAHRFTWTTIMAASATSGTRALPPFITLAKDMAQTTTTTIQQARPTANRSQIEIEARMYLRSPMHTTRALSFMNNNPGLKMPDSFKRNQLECHVAVMLMTIIQSRLLPLVVNPVDIPRLYLNILVVKRILIAIGENDTVFTTRGQRARVAIIHQGIIILMAE